MELPSDAIINLPSISSIDGNMKLLIDSGAVTSVAKEATIKEPSYSGKTRSFTGFGGLTQTSKGSTPVDLQFDSKEMTWPMQVFGNLGPTRADAIIGRDFLKGRVIMNWIDETISIKTETKGIANVERGVNEVAMMGYQINKKNDYDDVNADKKIDNEAIFSCDDVKVNSTGYYQGERTSTTMEEDKNDKAAKIVNLDVSSKKEPSNKSVKSDFNANGDKVIDIYSNSNVMNNGILKGCSGSILALELHNKNDFMMNNDETEKNNGCIIEEIYDDENEHVKSYDNAVEAVGKMSNYEEAINVICKEDTEPRIFECGSITKGVVVHPLFMRTEDFINLSLNDTDTAL